MLLELKMLLIFQSEKKKSHGKNSSSFLLTLEISSIVKLYCYDTRDFINCQVVLLLENMSASDATCIQ